MKIHDIIGHWTLVSHGRFDAAGVFTPSGQNMQGSLLYAPDGTMSVLILKAHDPKTLTDIVAYAGRYSVAEDRITHHIEVAPSPARRGTAEIRLATLSSGTLTLRTEKEPSGYFEIVWKRA